MQSLTNKERETKFFILSQATDKGARDYTWTLYDGEKIDKYDAAEIPALLRDILDRDSKHTLRVYINRLTMYVMDIIKALWVMGASPVAGNPPIKKMCELDYKYLVSDTLQVYNITLRHHKRGVSFVDMDNIITVRDCEETIKAYNTEPTGDLHTDYATALYNAITTLDSFVGVVKKPPITIAGYSRRYWCKTDDYYQHRTMIPDANAVKLPTKETLEEYCRGAYHGGLNIIRPSAATAEIIEQSGLVLDVNSLYPYIMYTKILPYGNPHYYKGKPTDDVIRDVNNGHIYLYIRIRAAFTLKEGAVPCVQLPRKNKQRFMFKRGWLENSCYYNYHEDKYIGEPQLIELTLTQTDYALFMENYDIQSIEYVDYIWFAATSNLFKQYIEFFYPIKKNAQTEAERYTAKMLLNALSGNMARLPEYENAIIHVTEKGDVAIDVSRSGGGISHIYIGSAITSYARAHLIHYAKMCGDRWLYSDTDSIHLVGTDIPEEIKIGDNMGEFKIEKRFDRVIYYKYKEYAMEYHGQANYTLAGIPRACVKLIEAYNSREEFDYTKHDLINPYEKRLTRAQCEALEQLFAAENPAEVDDIDDDAITASTKEKLYNKLYSIKTDLEEMGLNALKFCDIPIMTRSRVDPWESDLKTQFIGLYDNGFLEIRSGSR